MSSKIIIIAVILISVLLLAGFYFVNLPAADDVADVNDICVESTGYTWCDDNQECFNFWEQKCEEDNNSIWEETGSIVGGDADEHDCIGSAGYQWCEEKQKCLRVWEEECLGLDENVGLPGPNPSEAV